MINGLKREELVALNSTLLHELYFASMGGDGQPTEAMSAVLARDFGSVLRWKDEFVAMGNALAGGSGWVVLVYLPRDRRLVNQYASEHSQAVAGGIPILALDMYEHAYHMDYGANAKAYVDTFMRNVDWKALYTRYEDAAKVGGLRPLEQPEFGDLPSVGVEEVKAMLDTGKPVQVVDARPRASVSRTPGSHARRHVARSGARAGMGRRAVEVGPGGRVLRLRLPRRMQDRHQAAGSRLRREVHDGRPLGVESDRRADEAVRLTVGSSGRSDRRRYERHWNIAPRNIPGGRVRGGLLSPR